MLPLIDLCKQLKKLQVAFYLRDDDDPGKCKLMVTSRTPNELYTTLTPELHEAIRHWRPTIIKLLKNHVAYCLFTHPETLEDQPCRICHDGEEDTVPDEIADGLLEGVNEELQRDDKPPMQGELWNLS